jgi:hypothetical protein
VAAVYVSAPQVRVTSGDTVQLTAVARDAGGNPVTSGSVSWNSNNSAVAKVDSSGMVTAGALGMADVSAAMGGRTGVIRLQVLPQRIEVTPADASLTYGSQQQYSAVAFNSQNQPIPNVNFAWRILVAGGQFDSSTVTISNGGMVNATTLGYFVVRAGFVYANTPDQFEREFDGSTTVRVVPGDYKVTNLVSSALTYPSLRMRGKRTPIAVNDSGQLAFSTTLDGLTNALMTWNSSLNVLATAGTPGAMAGTVFYDFDNVSIDSQGNVLATAFTIGSSNSLVLANAAGLQLLLPDRAVADAVLDVTNVSTNRFSLSGSGDVALRGNFRYDGSTVNYAGLLRWSGGGLFLEASSKNPLPGLTGTVTFDDQYGLDGQGVLYFSASAGSGRAVYRKDPFKSPVKVIAVGDTLNGIAVRQLLQIAVAAGGDLVVQANLTDNSQVLLRYAGGFSGGAPTVMNSSPGYINQLYAVNAKGGVVWLGDAGPGYGLYLWAGDNTAPRFVLPRFGPSPTGEPVVDFYSAAVDGSGNVYASVRCVDTAWMLARVGGSPLMIANNGTPVAGPASLDLSTQLVLGGRTGAAHVLAGSNQRSIFQVDKSGLLPALVVGDRLPGGNTFTGNYSIVKSPSGDLIVTTDNGTFRLTSTGQSLVSGFPYQFPDGVSFFSPNNVAVNDHNQFVMLGNTNQGHQRLALFDGQAFRTIGYFNGGPPYQTPAPGGGVFTFINEIALNEAGQAMITAGTTAGASGVYFYDGNAWQSVCIYQTCKRDADTITNGFQLRASNNKFCMLLTMSNGFNRADCWEGGAWTKILRPGELTSDGTEINNMFTLDVNRKGDVALYGNTAGLGNPSVFLKTADGIYTVQSPVLQPEDGYYLLGIYSLDLKDDRRVFFVAQDWSGRMAVYEADPQF